MTQPRTLIIIPTYNEKDNVAQMVQAILSLKNGYHILFIDDNSPDGTAHHIEMLMEKHPEVFLEKRPGKLGLGTAYIHGFKWALQRDYVYIIEMDCDFSHDPKDLPRLVEACQNGADVAVGSRYVRGGRVRNWPLKRILMSYFASVYVRLILWINIKDTTAGFKCYQAKVLCAIAFAERCLASSMSLEMAALLAEALRNKCGMASRIKISLAFCTICATRKRSCFF